MRHTHSQTLVISGFRNFELMSPLPMHHFNIKSLVFYGVAISSVLVLFKLVTTYGESQLKAAKTLGDRYSLQLAEKLGDCSQAPNLQLQIQQSGIYLNGFLLPEANPNTPSAPTHRIQPTLTGKLINHHQQISLSGNIPQTTLCPDKNTPGNLTKNISLHIPLVNPKNLTGQMNITGNSQAIKFTLVPTPTREKSSQSH
jgi:hypothetical protein